MPNIEVNHGDLKKTAEEIRSYLEVQDQQMLMAKSAMNGLLAEWQGEDAMKIGTQWEKVNDIDSSAIRFRKSLRNYADAIEQCANEYKNAQIKVLNKAEIILLGL